MNYTKEQRDSLRTIAMRSASPNMVMVRLIDDIDEMEAMAEDINEEREGRTRAEAQRDDLWESVQSLQATVRDLMAADRAAEINAEIASDSELARELDAGGER